MNNPKRKVLRSVTFWVFCIAVWGTIVLSGCNGCQDSPAAATPTNPNVLAVLAVNGPWTNVGPNPSGQFEILPSGLPSGGIKVFFSAPYPTALHVTLDGVDLPQLQEGTSGANMSQTGYFDVISINPNPNPALWQVGIRAPDAKLSAKMYQIGISDISANPNYPAGNPNHESTPLLINEVLQKVFTVTVFKTGTGRGDVSSNPAGIVCGGTCIVDFGQSMTVTLTPHADSNSTFTGWSGDCTGQNSCNITLNGKAAIATANFSNTGNSTTTTQACPGGKFISGFTYLGDPGCATNDIAGHPSALLQCDSSGYFCCEMAQGSSDPKCGADHRQFAPDCMAFGPKGLLKQPNGCYAIDGP